MVVALGTILLKKNTSIPSSTKSALESIVEVEWIADNILTCLAGLQGNGMRCLSPSRPDTLRSEASG